MTRIVNNLNLLGAHNFKMQTFKFNFTRGLMDTVWTFLIKNMMKKCSLIIYTYNK